MTDQYLYIWEGMSLASILGTNTKDIDAVIYLCCYSKELYHKIILGIHSHDL